MITPKSGLLKEVPGHHFTESMALALHDSELKAQLRKYLGTDILLDPFSSVASERTCDLINWALKIARSDLERPEKLRAVISASKTENALAVWGSSKIDWVVMSDGLLQLLQAGANDVGSLLVESQPWLFETALGRRLQQIPALPGCQTPTASFLYFAAVTFFVGHEAGHHYLGHDGYYNAGAHAERGDVDPVTASPLTAQALEFQADRYGAGLARRSMAFWLTQLWDIEKFTDEEIATYQGFLAVFLSVGVMMALVRIKPRPIEDWTVAVNAGHPPAVLRMVGISDCLTAVLKEHLKKVPDDARRSIRLFSLSLAAETTIGPGSKYDELRQERLAREGNAAALRAVGLRRAIYDPATPAYLEEIQRRLDDIRPQLTPRK